MGCGSSKPSNFAVPGSSQGNIFFNLDTISRLLVPMIVKKNHNPKIITKSRSINLASSESSANHRTIIVFIGGPGNLIY
jgi:hypothetical protein